MKKVSAVVILGSLFLMGCQNGNQSSSEPISTSKEVEMEIESGSLIIPFSEYSEVSKYEEEETDEGLLLTVKLTNKSSETLHVFADDFELVTDNGEAVANSDFSVSEGLFDTKNIQSKKTITAKLMFPLEESKSYTLTYSSKISEESMDVSVKVPVEKYENSKKDFNIPVDLSKSFVNYVFLGEEEEGLEDKLTNNLKDIREKYQTELRKFIKESLFYSGKLTDEDLDKVVDAFLKKQKSTAKIDYRLTGYFNHKARVTMNVEAIDMESLSEIVDEYKKEYIEKNDYDSQKAAEYALEHLPEIFDAVKTSSPKKPMNLLMKEKDGKWTIDTSDYTFEQLVKTMEGNIY